MKRNSEHKFTITNNSCCKGSMLKKMSKVSIGLSCAALTTAMVFPVLPRASATTENTTFQVNVKESIAVSITTPADDAWAQGDVDTLLRNKISVNVTSNGSTGFTAGMTTGSSTSAALTNTTRNEIQLNTLASNWTRSNTSTTNFWGYSLDDANQTGTYRPMVNSASAPITIMSSSNGASGSQDVYFGAKADMTQASGTYTGTIVVSVVTGNNGVDIPAEQPVNPATPATPENQAVYTASTGGSANGTTTYSYTRSNTSSTPHTTTTTSQVSDGDNVAAYQGYTPPQGVTDKGIVNTISNVSNNSSVATALATAASVTAASGAIFFIAAKRKKDEEDEQQRPGM